MPSIATLSTSSVPSSASTTISSNAPIIAPPNTQSKRKRYYTRSQPQPQLKRFKPSEPIKFTKNELKTYLEAQGLYGKKNKQRAESLKSGFKKFEHISHDNIIKILENVRGNRRKENFEYHGFVEIDYKIDKTAKNEQGKVLNALTDAKDQIIKSKRKIISLSKQVKAKAKTIGNIQHNNKQKISKIVNEQRQSVNIKIKMQQEQIDKLKRKLAQTEDIKIILHRIAMEADKQSEDWSAISKLVLDKSRFAQTKCYVFHAGQGNTLHLMSCSQINLTTKDPSSLRRHVSDLNEFINIKTKKDAAQQKRLVSAFALSQKWKKIISNKLERGVRLSERETVIDYIKSHQSVARWSKCNVDRNKKLKFKALRCRTVVERARKEQEMKTACCEWRELEVTKANADEKDSKNEIESNQTEKKKLPIWYCSPMEQIVRSYEMELDRGSSVRRTHFGKDSLLSSDGVDKYGQGTMCSLILNVKENGNNESNRRRPIAFMDAPASESTNNLQVLWSEIRSEMTIMKENNSFIEIKVAEGGDVKHHVASVACCKLKKKALDASWAENEDVNPAQNPKSMLESESLFRNRHWNLSNYNISKLYIIDCDYRSFKTYIFHTQLGEYFISINSVVAVDEIFVWERSRSTILDGDKSEFTLIGRNEFYNGAFDLSAGLVQTDDFGNKYIPFRNETVAIQITYHVHQINGDLSSFDSRFGFGSHSCKCFCVFCRTQNKNGFNESVCFRTRKSIEENRKLYQESVKNPSLLASGQSPIQFSFGVGPCDAETYPCASRIIPSLLHMGMGVASKICKIEEKIYANFMDPNKIDRKIRAFNAELKKNMFDLNDINRQISDRKRRHKSVISLTKKQKKLISNYKERQSFLKKLECLSIDAKKVTEWDMMSTHCKRDIDAMRTEQMVKCKVYKNKYYKNFEGRQSLIYRKYWAVINECIKSTKYYFYMSRFMESLNDYHVKCGKAKHLLTDSDLSEARILCEQMVDDWNNFRDNVLCLKAPPKPGKNGKKKEENILDMNSENFTLGAKGHYYPHSMQFQEIWKMSNGHCDEESVEKFHKDSTAVLLRYKSQRGLLRIKYAMNHLLLITSPAYMD